MSKDECDQNGGQRCSEKNVEELCGEGHEGYGYQRENGEGPFAWRNITGGPTRTSANANIPC